MVNIVDFVQKITVTSQASRHNLLNAHDIGETSVNYTSRAKFYPLELTPSYFLQNTIGELFAPTHTNTWYMDS